jgi:hypothetical protein
MTACIGLVVFLIIIVEAHVLGMDASVCREDPTKTFGSGPVVIIMLAAELPPPPHCERPSKIASSWPTSSS